MDDYSIHPRSGKHQSLMKHRRERIATAALTGLLQYNGPTTAANRAVLAADALIARLDKEPENG